MKHSNKYLVLPLCSTTLAFALWATPTLPDNTNASEFMRTNQERVFEVSANQYGSMAVSAFKSAEVNQVTLQRKYFIGAVDTEWA